MTNYTELPGAEVALHFLALKRNWPGEMDAEVNHTVYVDWDWDGNKTVKVDPHYKTYINCSDTFFWGSSDGEELTEENIHILEETMAELKEIWKKYDAEFSAHVRGPALGDARAKWLEDNPGIESNTWGQSAEFKEAKKPQDLAYRKMQGVEAALEDLFAARVREMRPQGACYSRYPEELWPLFSAAGPERETGLGNPYKPGEYNR